jgi:hypothetical protein
MRINISNALSLPALPIANASLIVWITVWDRVWGSAAKTSPKSTRSRSNSHTAFFISSSSFQYYSIFKKTALQTFR